MVQWYLSVYVLSFNDLAWFSIDTNYYKNLQAVGRGPLGVLDPHFEKLCYR